MKRKIIRRNKNKFSYEFKKLRWQKVDGKRLVYVNMFPFYGLDNHHMVAKYVFATKSKDVIHDWRRIKWWFGLL